MIRLLCLFDLLITLTAAVFFFVNHSTFVMPDKEKKVILTRTFVSMKLSKAPKILIVPDSFK